MNHHIYNKIILLGLLLTCVLSHAQTLELAKDCVACHGQQGISTNAIWPNLAGQHRDYLLKQLLDLKQGTLRQAPTMNAILAKLNEKDMAELASYYAHLPRASGHTPEQFVKRGEALYRGGDLSKHITACIACHGPKGTGNEQAGFPVLSGQQAEYTRMQLQQFKQGTRKNDLNHIMQDISARMSPEDMEAVAHYVEGLY
jgi:cytochrome c553